jgi:diguanylate cyclase (GGDEF)-like protein
MVDGLPIPVLRDAAAQLGHVDAEIDLDGRVRRIYLRAGAGAPRHAALALALHEQIAPSAANDALPGLRAAPMAAANGGAAPWRRDYEVLLPRMQLPPAISLSHVLQTPQLRDGLRGRPVLIGISASGLGGELASPLAGGRSHLASVQLHAQAFEALRSGRLVTPAPAWLSAVFALLFVIPVWWWTGNQRLPSGGWVIGYAALPFAANAAMLHGLQWWVAPWSTVLALLLAAATCIVLQLRTTRRKLARNRKHALATLEAIGDGVITVNMQMHIRYANPVALRQIGNDAPIGLPLAQAIAVDDDGAAQLNAAIGECLHRAHAVRPSHHLRLRHAQRAGDRMLQASVSPLRDPAGRIEGAVLVLADVTESVASANRLQYAATHDALTGLPNRLLLHERLKLALARAQRLDSTVAVMFLDLDRFKRINDSLGHSHGDEVLRVTARRLGTICRSTDFVARWGGDEFVVVMEDVSGETAIATAASKLVAALGEDLEVNGMRMASSCSVGIALSPQDGNEIDILLAKADTAMYRAKSHPDTGFHFYSSDLKIWTRERLALEVELRHALREGLFEVHYQPQYRLGDGALVGFEALLRWRQRPDTLVQPADFIGVAEESGLIVDIGAWVVQRVTRDIADWVAHGHQPMPVAVNVSARQCINRNIVDVVRNALQGSGIAPALLKLEITETTAMTDAARVIELLEEIKALGVRIAVDDFGTGYSSLAYLKRFPIDELKIDRSFVQDVATDADDAAIVRATIALAHELGIQVVAEGVETRQQSAFLSAQSCDIVQGFLYGRPQPLDQTTPLL